MKKEASKIIWGHWRKNKNVLIKLCAGLFYTCLKIIYVFIINLFRFLFQFLYLTSTNNKLI